MSRAKQVTEILGLGDVIEMTRRQFLKTGLLLGVLPHHKPSHKPPRPVAQSRSGLTLLMH